MRLAPILLTFVLVASACAADANDSAQENDSVQETTADVAADGGGVPASGSSDATPRFDYSTVDYDAEPAGSALRGDRNSDAFPPPLVDTRDIVSGGPPPDGIPPIDRPVFVSIDEVDFIDDDNEGVVVIELNGDARAYPIQILIWHEIVNDEVGGVPVTITYCPLCNSAVVYERQLGGRLLDFGTSGELYQSALVMYDRQTQSLWAHFTGQGIVGHYAGAQLELVAAQTIGYGSFVEAFPDGQVLAPVTGFERPYGSNPYVGYDDEETGPIGGFISQNISDEFAAKTRLVGVTDDIGSFSILLEDLASERVVHVVEGGRNVVVLHTDGLNSSIDAQRIADGRDVGQTGAFIAEALDGTNLTFEVDGSNFRDEQTGSTWNVLGQALGGPLAGERLQGVPHVDSFWFSWSTYRPDQIRIQP